MPSSRVLPQQERLGQRALNNALTVNGADTGVTIDAAGYTKGLKLNGGTGDDTITGGAGADDMAGGLGNDVFVIGNADSGVTTVTADIIRGFVTGNRQTSISPSLEVLT